VSDAATGGPRKSEALSGGPAARSGSNDATVGNGRSNGNGNSGDGNGGWREEERARPRQLRVVGGSAAHVREPEEREDNSVTLLEVLNEIKAMREDMARLDASNSRVAGMMQSVSARVDKFEVVVTKKLDEHGGQVDDLKRDLFPLQVGCARAFEILGIDDGKREESIVNAIEGAEAEWEVYAAAQNRVKDMLIPRADADGKLLRPSKDAMVKARADVSVASKKFQAARDRFEQQRATRLAGPEAPTLLVAIAATWEYSAHMLGGRGVVTTINERGAEDLERVAEVLADASGSVEETRKITCAMSVLAWFFKDNTVLMEKTPARLLEQVRSGKYIAQVVEEVQDGSQDKNWTREAIVGMTRAIPPKPVTTQ
jgi:hypothetical protein